MSINTEHKDYKKYKDIWSLVDDITESADIEKYLLTLNPTDYSEENRIRNDQYKKRAVFYEIAGYTLKGLVSLPFNKDVIIDVPDVLDYIKTNVNGYGVSIQQQAKRTLKETLKKSRCGLFVTFPQTTNEITKAELDKYYATIHHVDSIQIINWAYKNIGSNVVLSLVVIKETIKDDSEENSYGSDEVEQITELYLDDNNVYNVRKWRLSSDGLKTWVVYGDVIQPRNATGNYFNYIPFVFIGSEYNSANVSEPLLKNLCYQNIAHYRNSADYEDSIFYCGQSQPWMSGVTEEHVRLMKANKMYIGSRNLFGVPSGETFGFANASPNTMVRQAMLDKIDLMVGLGARFIRDPTSVKTATEVTSELVTSTSILSNVVGNVNDAYNKALNMLQDFMIKDKADITFKINNNFIDPKATAQDIQAMISGFIQGAIPNSDYLKWLKQHNLVEPDKTLEDFNDEINPVTDYLGGQ